ncbi:hypothetical protein GLOTRDRAFT_138279 [Gloeophyllum trabeum ATCC 11539]|uniref:ZZ-type domain-containing protein n=1 Tax=Gloeophyllum trabeum (strain ATCC 11539 / FP-39264 / Madison 617) TaxID=670483 RepID=S7RTW1_GLOTA|nr:uncharacterized protein GLOTRDRAFT_138279 [Gloeophyllum trabeum ATCC 11539]EPQ56589.1 hypothetical protein GLOTRDRAFT_138279 [Gloeophyllum trabeum ATCC 11539]
MSPASNDPYSVSTYADSISSRPDRTLVVKCTFDRSNKRITFSSARNCSYQLLRDRVEQCFSLSASSFVISYKDDDGEVTDITNELDLTEAIYYFHTDASSEPASSASSILSGRSFGSLGSKKITLRIQVTVDYDGPSLSDSSSLASLDDYRGRQAGSELSLNWSAPGSEIDGTVDAEHEPEDDAVTISSRDTGGSVELERTNGHQGKARSHLPPVAEDRSDLGSQWELATVANNRTASPSLESVTSRNVEDPSAVFSRLKLSESSSPLNAGPSCVPLTWLQDQNNRTIKAMLGALPEPSETDTSSISLRSTEDGDGDVESLSGGDLSLQRDHRGKYYYSYTSAGSGSVSTHDSGYQDDDSLSATYDPTRSSMQVDGNPFVDPQHGLNAHPAIPSGSRSASEPVLQIHPSIPPEVLRYLNDDAEPAGPPPEQLTSCSECGVMLEAIRYVCATCGEKRPVSQRDTGGDAMSPFEDPSEYSGGRGLHVPTPSSSANSSRTYIADRELPEHRRYATDPHGPQHERHHHHHHYDPLDPRHHYHAAHPPHPHPHAPHHPHQHFSPSRSIPNGSLHPHPFFHPRTSSLQNGYMSLASSTTLHGPPSDLPASFPSSYTHPSHSPSSSHSSSGSTPTSPSVPGGYELCSGCIEQAGVNHALEVVGGGAGPGMTMGVGRSRGPEALSQWRRAAPRQKGQLRHAYIEKVWGPSGWEDVEQDNKRNCKCSTCGTDIVSKRYKCASCQDFNLCIACYGQVHEVHPSHAFLSVPDKPARSKSDSDILGSTSASTAVDLDPEGGEPSMKHPGVKCAHCMQDIVGARFHCAICESVDICSNCESAGLPGNLDSTDDGHNSSHIMIKIPYPLETTEVQTASKRAKHLWRCRDAADVGCDPVPDSPPMSSYAKTVVGSGKKGAESVRDTMDHHILCDGCGMNIVGVRYQCASCSSSPTPYSLCAHCEERSYLLHDPMHIFVKLPRPVDRPLQSPMFLIPRIYTEPVGARFRATRNSHPKDYLDSVLHTHTWCDRCMTRIRGEWFHCGFCPKDLCSDCEAMDTHDNTHVFLVLKAPVDLRFFKRDAEFVDSGGGTPRPIIPYPIYRS